LIEHGAELGLQEGHCPLCAAVRSSADFNEAISSARARLAARGERLLATSRALKEARNTLDSCANAFDTAQQRLTEEELRRDNLERSLDSIRAVYEKHSFRASPSDPERAKQAFLVERERIARLERALFLLETSTAVDRLASLESRAEALKQRVELELSKLDEAERAVDSARQIDVSSREVANQMLTEQFDTVLPLLQELYRRIRPHSEWMEIESDFGGRIRASLNLTVGDGHNLQFLFSSGQRR